MKPGAATVAVLMLLGPAAGCNRPRSEPVLDADPPPSAGPAAADGATPPEGGPGPDAGVARPIDAAGAASFPDPFVPLDGTRIKGRWAEAPGKLRIWLGWYDVVLQADCEFRRAADGELRCLPRAMTTTYSGYTDAGCTTALVTPAVLDAPTCAPKESARFVARDDILGCQQSQTTVNLVGAPWAGPVYYVPPYGSCTTRPMPGTLLQIGEVVPPSSFVKAVEVLAPLSDGAAELEPVLVVAEDGAQGLLRWQERATGATCVLSPGADARELCTTGDAKIATGFLYSDAQCTRPTISRFVRECRPMARHLLAERATCPAGFDAFQVGPAISQGFRRQGGACVPEAAPGGDFVTFALGPRIADENVPALQTVFDRTGTERLRAAWKVAPRGRRVLASELFDSQRQQFCRPLLFQDGLRRCFSGQVDAYPPSFFADAACTRPLYRTFAWTERCVPPQVAVGDGSCPRRHRVLAVGSPHTGPVWTKYTDTCEAGSLSERESVYTVTPVPDADFPLLTIEEPR